MSTSSPVRKVHDVPIVQPQPVPVEPLRLPDASPSWIVPAPISVPARTPVRKV